MDYVILIGIIISAIGVVMLILTTRYVWGWNSGYPYRTTNKFVSFVGWLLLILGLLIIIVKAKFNGQLG